MSKFLFLKYLISHKISVKTQSYSNCHSYVRKHVAWYTSLDFLHVSMCICHSKTYKCDLTQPPIPNSCLFYLSLKIQMTFARVCYCDFSIVTHHVTILKFKDCYAFCLLTKTSLAKSNTFFTDKIFLITEVLLLIDNKG